ncbi:MAG: hypothetical protein ACPGWR_33480, partial [Ardenticatenaceae bacterium]
MIGAQPTTNPRPNMAGEARTYWFIDVGNRNFPDRCSAIIALRQAQGPPPRPYKTSTNPRPNMAGEARTYRFIDVGNRNFPDGCSAIIALRQAQGPPPRP